MAEPQGVCDRIMVRFWKTSFARHMAGAGVELLEAGKSLSVNNLLDEAIGWLEEKRQPKGPPKKIKIR
ncbi:MAG: hypothetical protein ACE5IC_03685 [Candidatus Brocadiales bacterium]